MDRETDVIELGVASVETQGPALVEGDEKLGIYGAGLADD